VAGGITPPTASSAAKMRDIDRKFILTHDSPVYDAPDTSARVIAQVHRGKWVHVTGIGSQWFRIRLRDGAVGFIPIAVAE
jgi:hypothetical protein